MIVFDLECDRGHRFEGWFKDSPAYETQRENNLIVCPVCNSIRISRIPSSFAIRSSGGGSSIPPDPGADLQHLGRQIAEYMEQNFDDVGCNFAKEALKIHYGASEPRNIRGISTPEEEKTLKEEGITFVKFPVPPPPDADS